MKTSESFAGVHEEFVKVLQGASSLYRFGSDRIRNAYDNGQFLPRAIVAALRQLETAKESCKQ